METHLCELCRTDGREYGKRYCKTCEKIMKDRMKSSGYFVPTPRLGTTRTVDQKENVRETKYGSDR